MPREIVLATEVQATADRVYDALATNRGLASFWTPSVSGEVTSGARLAFGFAEAPVDLEMVVTRLEPDRVVEWECPGPWPTWAGTRIRWGIGGQETLVTFRHSGWDDSVGDVELGSVAMTWAAVLRALSEYARTGLAAPALS